MDGDSSAVCRQLREEAQAIEAAWLVPTGRVLSIYVQPAGGDAPGLHFSCVTLAGGEALAIDLPMVATLSELESTIKGSLEWAALDFVSRDLRDGAVAPAHAARGRTASDAKASEFDGTPESSLRRAWGVASCWCTVCCGCSPYGPLGARAPEPDGVPPVDAEVAGPGDAPGSSLCCVYEALVARELASPEGMGRDYRDGRVDTGTCRRCGGGGVTWNRFMEWCKMNGDAGGRKISVCMSCGLYLEEHWDDYDD